FNGSQVGEEVIKRAAPGRVPGADAGDEALRTLAVETARSDGYDLPASAVVIARQAAVNSGA
ncbi:MAG: hypothetical protein M1541_04335, partial [Acidobacteria bacterium]|nr:hypothetical protein [Acidobacteriota bacterium]